VQLTLLSACNLWRTYGVVLDTLLSGRVLQLHYNMEIIYFDCSIVFTNYRSVPGKHPWVISSHLACMWHLNIWDINCMYLYRSCYTKCSAWALGCLPGIATTVTVATRDNYSVTFSGRFKTLEILDYRDVIIHTMS
jgi:hypothetical protein